MKKYKLTNEKLIINDVTLYRIEALRDIPPRHVYEGDTGGFVQSERNLSQADDAWVYGNAQVYGNAMRGCTAMHG